VHALTFHLEPRVPFWDSTRIDHDGLGETPDQEEHEDVYDCEAHVAEEWSRGIILQKNLAVYEGVGVVRPGDEDNDNSWWGVVQSTKHEVAPF